MAIAVLYCISAILHHIWLLQGRIDPTTDAMALISHYSKYSLAYSAIGISAFLYPRDIRIATLMVALIGCFVFLPAIEVSSLWSRWPILALLGAIIGFEFTTEKETPSTKHLIGAFVPALVFPAFLITLDIICKIYLPFMFG